MLLLQSVDTTDDLSIWRGPLSWRQLMWWKERTLLALGWDSMTQADIICELEIVTENDSNRIVIRYSLSHIVKKSTSFEWPCI